MSTPASWIHVDGRRGIATGERKRSGRSCETDRSTIRLQPLLRWCKWDKYCLENLREKHGRRQVIAQWLCSPFARRRSVICRVTSRWWWLVILKQEDGGDGWASTRFSLKPNLAASTRCAESSSLQPSTAQGIGLQRSTSVSGQPPANPTNQPRI